MAINLATLTPASTKAKNVATEEYVDTSTDAFATSIYYPDTTEIDGGKIRTNTINADRIIAGTSMSAPLINGGTINGGTIAGVNIVGSVIKSSWIDYSTTAYLTNWQVYTTATVPTAYIDNFAKDPDTGLLVEDSQGFVRLPKKFGFSPEGSTGSISNSYTYDFNYDFIAFDDYTVNNYNRPFTSTANFGVLGNSATSIQLAAFTMESYNGTGATNYTETTLRLGVDTAVIAMSWRFNSGASNSISATVTINGTRTYTGSGYPSYTTTLGNIFNVTVGYGTLVVTMAVSNQLISLPGFTLSSGAKFGMRVVSINNDSNAPTTLTYNFPALKEY